MFQVKDGQKNGGKKNKLYIKIRRRRREKVSRDMLWCIKHEEDKWYFMQFEPGGYFSIVRKKTSTFAVISSKRGKGKKKAHFLQVSLMFACQVLINLRYLAEFLPSAAEHNHIQFFLDRHLGQLVCLRKQIKLRHLNSAAPSWRPTGVGTKQIIQMNSQASFFLFNRSTSWRK